MAGIEMETDRMSIIIAPSIICADLCNLEREVHTLEEAGAELIHVDFIDGRFSPSLPIGIDTIRALRRCTGLPMSLHLMSENNEHFLEMLSGIGFSHIVFHWETTHHADRLLNKIHSMGMEAGIALTPATPVSVVEYVLEKCDVVLLMLINPGYAFEESEEQIPYAKDKIMDMKALIERRKCHTKIELDGRVRIEQIPDFVSAGADIIVSGSSGVFTGGCNYKENFQKIQKIINNICET